MQKLKTEKKTSLHSGKYSSITYRWNHEKEKTGSILFYELCLKIITYSIYEFFSIAHSCRMPQFEILIRSRNNPLNMETLILVVFIDVTVSMPELTNS